VITVHYKHPNGDEDYFITEAVHYEKGGGVVRFIPLSTTDNLFNPSPIHIDHGTVRVMAGNTWYAYELGEPANG
jgi:hypothetical protein